MDRFGRTAVCSHIHLNRLQFHDDQKYKKERSKKELKQRSKNETKWQKEQPLQLAGFGSGRNACQRMCGYPATSFDLGLDNLRIFESQTIACSTVRAAQIILFENLILVQIEC